MPCWLGIAIGGALGAPARYFLSLSIQGRLGSATWAAFPLSTLIINTLGSFLLGVVLTLDLRGLVSPALRLAFGTGFVGAFTTFSTFVWESELLLRSGKGGRAALYIFGNLLMGYGAVLFGRWVGARVGGGS